MNLVSLDLLNWCQFPQFHCDFSPGLTAIIGPNGSGKSNLFGAIRWLLTGENPNGGSKGAKQEENIYQLSNPAERSRATLVFDHKGHRYTVTKHLRPAKEKSELTLDGTVVASGEREVSQRLATDLSDTATLNRYVLVSQGDIFAFLAEDPADRAKNFQRLFDLTIAEVGYKAFVDQLSTLQVGSGTEQTTIDSITGQLQTTRERLQAIQARLTLLPSSGALQEIQRNCTAILNANQQRQQYAQQLQQAQTALQQINTRVVEIEPQMVQLDRDLATLRQAARAEEGASDAAKAALANWTHHKQVAQQQQTLRSRVAAWTSQLVEAPPQPPNYRNADECAYLERHINDLQVEIQKRETVVTNFSKSGVAACPTCQTPTTQIQPVVEQYKLELPQLTQQRLDNQDRVATSRSYDTRYSRWQVEQAALHRNIATTEADLTALAVGQPPSQDEAALQAIVAGHQEYLDAIEEMSPAFRLLDTELHQLRGRRREVQSKADEAQTQLTAITTTPAQIEAAQQTQHESVTYANERLTLDAELQALTPQVQQGEQEIARLQVALQQREKTLAWVNFAGEIKALLHYSGAPKFVVHAKLQQLQVTVNELLAAFDTDYRVQADEGLSFVGHFTDGRVQPARRFSGGQKVVLAMAFRIAVNWLFAQDLGFLGLDEPTAYLDKKHIRAFRPILERLRTLVASRGLQCLMITHEDELAPLFDTAIQLS